MTLEVIPLPEVDEVKVTTIVDNNIDLLLPSSDVVDDGATLNGGDGTGLPFRC